MYSLWEILNVIRPSFAWRSILGAKHIVENGVGWRVENGASVKIWGDAWLPPPHTWLFIPPRQEIDPDSRLESLIDPNTGWWSLELINSLFDMEDTARIGSVILSPLRQSDKLIWKGTPSMFFFVKSAYHLEMKRLVQEKGESSGENGGGEFWKAIWSLRASPVLKSFCWKASNDMLPNMVNLYQKRIVPSPLCPIYGREPETLFHCLWRCPSAEAVWQEGSRKIQKLNCDTVDGRGLITFLFEKLDFEDLLEALTVARLICHRRNDYVFGRGFTSPTRVMAAVRISLESFSLADCHYKKLCI